eukprot:2890992-Pleurochrysis_carterae.AAC.1
MPTGRSAAKATSCSLRRCAGGGSVESASRPRPSASAAAVSGASSSKCSCLRSARGACSAVPAAAPRAAPAAAASAAFSAISWRISRARGDSSTSVVSAVDALV